MNYFMDDEKNCMNCKHLYVDDIYEEFMCDINNTGCRFNFEEDSYYACDKYEKNRQLFE